MTSEVLILEEIPVLSWAFRHLEYSKWDPEVLSLRLIAVRFVTIKVRSMKSSLETLRIEKDSLRFYRSDIEKLLYRYRVDSDWSVDMNSVFFNIE